MGLTYEIAKFVKEHGFSDFSKEDVKVSKDLIFDCLGVMIFGSRERVSQIVAKYLKDSGGVPECGVIGARFKTSLTNAVLFNGTSAHAPELEAGGSFVGSVPITIIPVALSVAEKFNLSGKAVIEGIIIGLEVQAKLGMGGPGSFDRGFGGIPLFGKLGAAATTCKMMKMQVDQIQNAFGISIAQSSGQHRQHATMTHLLEAGFGCRDGVTAALLAKEGMTADPNLIEGERGFYDLYCSGGMGYDIEAVRRGLGKPYCITSPGIFVKESSNCFFTHKAMEALLDLMDQHNFRYEDVDSVQVDIPTFVAKILYLSEPKNGEEAKFSLQQALGSILVDGKPDMPYIRPFTDNGANDARYKEARKKINVVTRADWTSGRAKPWTTPVTVILKNGSKYTKGIDKFKVGAISKESLVRRHQILVQDFLSPEQIQRSIDLVFNLETLDDISELMVLATFGKQS